MSIKFNDLLNGLKKILKTNFPEYKIYTEEVIQNLTRPCFHINLMPLTSNNFNKYYREQKALVDISYFSDEKKDLQTNYKNFDMMNKLQNVINTDIKVLDRNINMQELEFDTIDKVLHTMFNLSWYNENEVTQSYINQFKIMQEVHINENVIGNTCVIITSNGEVFKTSEGGFYARCTPDEIIILRDSGYIKI